MAPHLELWAHGVPGGGVGPEEGAALHALLVLVQHLLRRRLQLPPAARARLVIPAPRPKLPLRRGRRRPEGPGAEELDSGLHADGHVLDGEDEAAREQPRPEIDPHGRLGPRKLAAIPAAPHERHQHLVHVLRLVESVLGVQRLEEDAAFSFGKILFAATQELHLENHGIVRADSFPWNVIPITGIPIFRANVKNGLFTDFHRCDCHFEPPNYLTFSKSESERSAGVV